MTVYWTWLVVSFMAGVGLTRLVTFILSLPRPPRPPRCTAVLRSGERCHHQLNHLGPHRTTIYLTASHTQGYVWEDPKAGLHAVGFFYRR